MITICKFRLVNIISYYWGPAKTLVFETYYDSAIPEDMRFFDATPSGKFEILVNNPKVLESYKLGDYYYLDITPIEKV